MPLANWQRMKRGGNGMGVVIGFLIGVIVGIGITAMCAVSSEADRKAGEQKDNE